MARSGGDGITVRPLDSESDREACFALQRQIWGEGLREILAPGILKVVQEVGGVAAGAFDGTGRLLGFVCGFSGVRDGRPSHWSHMLGIEPRARNRGLGRRLKLYQRELLLAQGIEEAFWTYDPLEARNAHLNLSRLGVEVLDYVRDYYGDGGSSPLHRGIGTDRFLVRWRLRGERTRAALDGRLPGEPERFAAAPVVNVRPGAEGAPEPVTAEPPELPAVRVEIPADIQAVKRASAGAGAAWRASTRAALGRGLERGLAVDAFVREPSTGRCFYILCRPC